MWSDTLHQIASWLGFSILIGLLYLGLLVLFARLLSSSSVPSTITLVGGPGDGAVIAVADEIERLEITHFGVKQTYWRADPYRGYFVWEGLMESSKRDVRTPDV